MERRARNILYEHVHLNFEGNYLIARALAEQIGRDLASSSEGHWPTADDCARRIGWNDSTRRAAEMDILSRLNDPPFKQQANNKQQYGRLLEQIARLQPATLPESLRAEKAVTRSAAESAPNDWILQENLANLQRQTGDIDGAVESLRQVARLLPHSADAWQGLGLALESDKRDDEAAAAFQHATALRPESVVSMNSLAELYAREGHTEQAAREFEEVLRLKPYWGPAHLGLGKALEAMGKAEEAKEQFEEALKNRGQHPGVLQHAGEICLLPRLVWRGRHQFHRLPAAVSRRSRNPSQSRHRAGSSSAGHAEAEAHFAEAVRLQPKFAEAHFCIGKERGQEGDAAGAAAEFAEAVRLKPELIEARLNLGIALSNQHLNQQALDQFDEVLRRDAKNKIALTYAKILRAHPQSETKNQ